MRDAERITRMLEKIENIWKRNPELRLGQLLSNCCPAFEDETFYIEDSVLEKSISDYIKKTGNL